MASARWSLRAIRDLRDLIESISDVAPAYAGTLATRIATAIQRIEAFPESGRIVPEYRRADTREVIVASYRLVYVLRAERVHLMGIDHGKRNLLRALGPEPWNFDDTDGP